MWDVTVLQVRSFAQEGAGLLPEERTELSHLRQLQAQAPAVTGCVAEGHSEAHRERLASMEAASLTMFLHGTFNS